MNTTVLLLLLPIFVVSQIICIVCYLKTRHRYAPARCFDENSYNGNLVTYEEAKQISLDALNKFGAARDGSLPDVISHSINEQTADVLAKWSRLSVDGSSFPIDVPSEMEQIQFGSMGKSKMMRIGHWSTGDEFFIAMDPDNMQIYVKETEHLYHQLACCIFHYIDYGKDKCAEINET